MRTLELPDPSRYTLLDVDIDPEGGADKIDSGAFIQAALISEVLENRFPDETICRRLIDESKDNGPTYVCISAGHLDDSVIRELYRNAHPAEPLEDTTRED